LFYIEDFATFGLRLKLLCQVMFSRLSARRKNALKKTYEIFYGQRLMNQFRAQIYNTTVIFDAYETTQEYKTA